jgi:hypothetical protein
MREIKFRAKPDKAYFFESDNVPTTDGFVFGTPDTRMLNVPGAEKWRKEHEMVDQPSIVAMTRDGWPCSVAVQEETIGQFTGMKDIDGHEIWEGDVVEVTCLRPNNDLGKVLMAYVGYDNDVAAFCLYHPDGRHGGTLCKNGDDAAIKVVGNIYDNPELIHDKKL